MRDGGYVLWRISRLPAQVSRIIVHHQWQAVNRVAPESLLVALPFALQAGVLNRLHNIVGELVARSSVRAAGDDQFLLVLSTDIKSHFKPRSFLGKANMPEEHGCGT